MAKTKISEYSSTANSNTDIASINIDEGCAPSGINNAIRALMAQLKDFQTGAASDPVTVGGVLTVTGGSAAAPAITTSGDTNTGVLFPAADTVGVTTGGTERVRVDSSGNVGIGTSSPAKRLSVVNATDATTVGTNAVMSIQAGSSVNSVAEIGFSYGSWGGTNPIASLGYQITSNAGVGAGALTFSTRSVTTDTAPSERMRIDSSGNVGIGTSSPSYKLQVNGFVGVTDGTSTIRLANSGGVGLVSTVTNHPLAFQTNDTERMRIDSSGNLLVGTTASSVNGRGARQVIFSNSAEAIALNIDNNNRYAMYSYVSTTTGTRYHIGFADGSTGSGGALGNITTNGSSVAYNTTSDYRLKENVAPMTGALDKITQLKPCTYTWKSSGLATQGFIAHELQEVIPDAVVGEKDAVDDNGNPVYQGIDTSFLVATLTAALQELKAIVDAQRVELDAAKADIAALKGQ